MSAKLLQALTDENPDLQKQIGCMTGIFQLFDRHHVLSPKRINGHTPKRLLPGKSLTLFSLKFQFLTVFFQQGYLLFVEIVGFCLDFYAI